MILHIETFIEKNRISDELYEKWKDEIFIEIIEYLENHSKYVLSSFNNSFQDSSKSLLLLSDHFTDFLIRRVQNHVN